MFGVYVGGLWTAWRTPALSASVCHFTVTVCVSTAVDLTHVAPHAVDFLVTSAFVGSLTHGLGAYIGLLACMVILLLC